MLSLQERHPEGNGQNVCQEYRTDTAFLQPKMPEKLENEQIPEKNEMGQAQRSQEMIISCFSF
jgi:hypothetical protein